MVAASSRKRSRAQAGLDGARGAVEQKADLLSGGGQTRGRADPVQRPSLDDEVACGRGKTTFRGGTEAIGGPTQGAGHLEPVGHDDLGGGRWRGRADVGREVGQRDIHLVARRRRPRASGARRRLGRPARR